MVHAPKLILGGAMLVIAGCGSATAGATAPSASASQRGGFGGGGTSGQLVQVNGTSLTVSTTNGDVTVTYTSSTPISQASTGPTADIVTGSCVVIVGTKDASGAITATSVRLTAAVNGVCATGNLGRPGAGGSFPARPSGAGAPAGTPTLNPNAAFVAGLVTTVVGTSVTVQPAGGAAPTTITIPTTITVNESHAASASDLAVDICLLARGQKNASGVVAATALTIEPATANGTCTVVGGGRGFGGGGFGGPPGAAPSSGA